MFNLDNLQSFVRTLLKIGGAWAANNGYATNDEVTMISGGAIALIGILWSALKHKE